MTVPSKDIRHESGERHGAFFIEREGRRVAEPVCSYVRIVFDRTPAYADVRKG